MGGRSMAEVSDRWVADRCLEQIDGWQIDGHAGWMMAGPAGSNVEASGQGG